MPRTSKGEVRAVFLRFLTVNGWSEAKSYGDVGGYTLDYAACYGGYVIEQVQNTGGGVSHPFGSRRQRAGEFVTTLYFAIGMSYHRERMGQRSGEG